MSNSIYKTCRYNKAGFLFLIVLCLLFINAPSVHALVENLQYDYDNSQQINKVTYDDGTEIEYVYDNSGNRFFKTTTLTGAFANNPPNAVAEPITPTNGDTDVSVTPTLTWTGGGDPDGDPIAYYIYLGNSTTPPLVSSGTTTSFSSDQLKSNTTYYWKVVTVDNHNVSTSGQLWSFTTTNSPPVASFEANVTIGLYPILVAFSDTSTDPDDSIASWEWDFENDSIIDSTEQHPFHTYTQAGLYTVSLTVTDMHGIPSTMTRTDYISVGGMGSISGTVIDEITGFPVQSVTVHANGVSYNVDHTDINGDYTITGLENGDYTVYATITSYLTEFYDDAASSSITTPVTVLPDQETSGIDLALAPDTDNDSIADDGNKSGTIGDYTCIGGAIADCDDNCVDIANTDQADMDSDGKGDLCDPDIDGDGYDDDVDVCPLIFDPLQEDANGDGYGDACTVDICVTSGDSAGLQNALNTAQADNTMGYVIKLEQGTYGVSNGFSYFSVYDHSLAIRGGYTLGSGCAERQADPANTVLDGGGISDVFSLLDFNTSKIPRSIQVEGMTIQNGKLALYINSSRKDVILRDTIVKDNNNGSLDRIVHIRADYGKAEILNNTITGNGAYNHAGLKLTTYIGEILAANNVITNNTADLSGGGVYVYAYGDGNKVYLINNTITGNNAYSGGGIYLKLMLTSTAELYNNIIWGNTAQTGADLYIEFTNSPTTINAFNNDFDPVKVYGTFTSEGDNINIDPLFEDVANEDYHLTGLSQCVDAGSNTAPFLPTFDYEGHNRVLDGNSDSIDITDIGADEYWICALKPARINTTPVSYYWTLQDAYDFAGDDVIEAQAGYAFYGDFYNDINKFVTLKGGFSCDYNTITGVTYIQGSMLISDGEVTISDGTLILE